MKKNSFQIIFKVFSNSIFKTRFSALWIKFHLHDKKKQCDDSVFAIFRDQHTEISLSDKKPLSIWYANYKFFWFVLLSIVCSPLAHTRNINSIQTVSEWHLAFPQFFFFFWLCWQLLTIAATSRMLLVDGNHATSWQIDEIKTIYFCLLNLFIFFAIQV